MNPEEIWEDFRSRIDELTSRKEQGWSQARLAREADVPLSSLNSFQKNPGRGMRQENYEKIEPILRKYLGPGSARFSGVNSASSGEKNADPVQLEVQDRAVLIAVIDLDDFDFPLEGTEMDKSLETDAVHHIPFPGARKRQHYIVQVNQITRLRKVMLLPGDRLLVDRRKKPKKGSVVILVIAKKGHIAEMEELENGKLAPVLSTGERPKMYAISGTVTLRLESLE